MSITVLDRLGGARRLGTLEPLSSSLRIFPLPEPPLASDPCRPPLGKYSPCLPPPRSLRIPLIRPISRSPAGRDSADSKPQLVPECLHGEAWQTTCPQGAQLEEKVEGRPRAEGQFVCRLSLLPLSPSPLPHPPSRHTVSPQSKREKNPLCLRRCWAGDSPAHPFHPLSCSAWSTCKPRAFYFLSGADWIIETLFVSVKSDPRVGVTFQNQG